MSILYATQRKRWHLLQSAPAGSSSPSCHSDNPVQLACLIQQLRADCPGRFLSALQAVHTLEDVGDSELPALAGGEVLRTTKIINKEVRAASRVAKTGMERLRDALTTVSSVQHHHIHFFSMQPVGVVEMLMSSLPLHPYAASHTKLSSNITCAFTVHASA